MAEVRIVIPTFDYRLNKNSPERYYETKYGKSGGYKQVLNTFEMYTRAELNHKGIKFARPEYLDVALYVYRPNTLHEAQNYGDEMWDIVKRALGIEDRHFSTHAYPVDPTGPDDKEFYPHFELILKGD